MRFSCLSSIFPVFFVCILSFFFPSFFFFFNDTATTEIYTLSLHDALPISRPVATSPGCAPRCACPRSETPGARRSRDRAGDRKSTRLNSSHRCNSYAVFCLKKKSKREIPNKYRKQNRQVNDLGCYADE